MNRKNIHHAKTDMNTKEESNVKNSNWNKFFIGFAVVTILSGIYLITQQNYVTGIGGSVTGFFLLYLQNVNHKKDV